MTRDEAQDLKCAWGAAIGSNISGNYIPLSKLPCSKVKLKYAIFVFVEEMVKARRAKLPTKDENALVVCYGMWDIFIEDSEAARLNIILDKIKNEKLYLDDAKWAPVREVSLKHLEHRSNPYYMDELLEHITACYAKYLR